MENNNEAAVRERKMALAEFQEKRDLIKAQERAERAKKPPFVVPAYYRPTTDDSSVLKPSNGMRRLSAGTTQKNVVPRAKCGTISGSRDNLAAPLTIHRANIRGAVAEDAVEQPLPVAQSVVATALAVDRPKANLSAVEEEEGEEDGSDGEEEQSDDDESNGSLHEPAIISGASAKTAATGCSAVDVVDVARRPPREGNSMSVHLPPDTNVGRRLCAILRLIGFSSLDSAEDSDLDADEEVDEEETDPQIVLPAARANNVYAEVSGNGISSHQVVDSPKSSKMRRRSEAVRLAADVSWIYNCTPEALAPSRERKTRYVGSYRPEALSPTDAGYANSLASARRNRTTSSITPAKKATMMAEKESTRSSSAPPGAKRVASGFPMKLRSHSHQDAESLNNNEHGNDESDTNSSSVYQTPENGESYFWDEVFPSTNKVATHQTRADLDLGPLPTDEDYPKLTRTPESLKRRARRETCMEKEIVRGILDSTTSDEERTPTVVYDHAYDTPSSILKKPDTPHSSQPKVARFAPGITSPPPRVGPLKRSSPNPPMPCPIM